MKIQELIQDDSKVVALMKKTDWDSEGGTVELAEEVIYELWKLDRSKAISLWEKHVPYAVKGLTPSFIVHRAIEEGLEFE